MNNMHTGTGDGAEYGQSSGDAHVLITAEAGKDVVIDEAWFLRADFDRETRH